MEPKIVRVVAGMHVRYLKMLILKFIIKCSHVTTLSESYDAPLFSAFRPPASCNVTIIAWPVLPRYANMVRYASRDYPPFGPTDKKIYIFR